MKLMNSSIDSMKVFINFGKVKLTEKGKRELYETRISLPEGDIKKLQDGEADLEEVLSSLSEEDFKRKAYIPKDLREKGISVRLMVVTRYFHGTGTYLEVLVNSKLLMKDYFKGITQETVKTIWERLNSLGLFYVDFEDFLDGHAVDVDFKVDVDGISEQEFRKFISLLNSIREGEIHTGLKNLGLQYGYRAKKSGYVSSPFIKLYYKPIELLNNSPEFAKSFLDGVEQLNLARIEGTVKNKKHFKSLGIKDSRLGYILEHLSGKKIVKLLGGFLNRYLRFDQIQGVGQLDFVEGVTPSDLDFMLYVKRSIKSGITLKMLESEVKRAYEVNGKSKSSTQRKVKKLRRFYRYLLESDPDLREESKFFKFIDLVLRGSETHLL